MKVEADLAVHHLQILVALLRQIIRLKVSQNDIGRPSTYHFKVECSRLESYRVTSPLRDDISNLVHPSNTTFSITHPRYRWRGSQIQVIHAQ